MQRNQAMPGKGLGQRGLLWLAGLTAAAGFAIGVQAQPAAVPAASPPSAADFFRMPLAARPALSPNGRYLAYALTQDKARTALVVMDLEQPGPLKAVGAFRDSDVNRIWWVNDERLVFDAIDRKPRRDGPTIPGLWAVNRDGSDFRQLIQPDYEELKRTGSRVQGKDRVLDWDWRLHTVLTDGSSDVVVANLVTNGVREVTSITLSRLDTRTALRTSLTDGAPPNVIGWELDQQGKPIVATSNQDGRFIMYRRKSGDDGWVAWKEGDAVRDSVPDILAVGGSREMYVVQGTAKGTSALFRVEPGTEQPGSAPLLSLDGYDFRGQAIIDRDSKRLLGVHYETDASGTAWFDAGMKEVQKLVDAQLPHTVNRILCQRCEGAPRMLIAAESDQRPVEYYVYQREARKVMGLFPSRPWLRGKPMGERDMQRFAARDGLPIPTLVTWPVGKPKGPQPAVVLVHGGPWVRGSHWAWEPQAQFLASRGYVVIEPEFRGSTGYGHPHFKAGWKQWGLAMQDDVADAVDWAVKQGWVDPKRVCIAGASYGGYAALMGLVRHQERYQCAINWVGVTDIDLMYAIHWSDSSDEWKQYGLPVLVGERVKDAAQIKETSPIHQAAKIRRPLLMAYGLDDWRVPIKHGTDFKAAVSGTNPDVEWVAYADEGHGWLMHETHIDFWTRVETFLGKHIGPKAVPK
ncbi:MAG: S9 family peptidase [Burkholderiaceae bacterium]|nr:S9 family peptidase [Burkholderiaceae bacterium]